MSDGGDYNPLRRKSEIVKEEKRERERVAERNWKIKRVDII